MFKIAEFAYLLSMILSVAAFAVHLTVKLKGLSATSSLAKQTSTTFFLLFILIFNISDYVIIYFGNMLTGTAVNWLYVFQNILEVGLVYALIYMEAEFSDSGLPRAVDFIMAAVIMILIYFDGIFDWKGSENETVYFRLMILINAVPIIILAVFSVIYLRKYSKENKDRRILGYFVAFILASIVLCIVSTATNADLQTSHHFIEHSREIFEFIWFMFNILTFVFVWRTVSINTADDSLNILTDEEMFDLVRTEYKLSERENEIAKLLYIGKNNKAIADELCLSPNTVKVHASNLYHKLGVTNRVEAVQLMSEMKNSAKDK